MWNTAYTQNEENRANRAPEKAFKIARATRRINAGAKVLPGCPGQRLMVINQCPQSDPGNALASVCYFPKDKPLISVTR